MNKAQISKALNLARGTVIKYVRYYEKSSLTYTDLMFLDVKDVVTQLRSEYIPPKATIKLERLQPLFPVLHQKLLVRGNNLKLLWQEYSASEESAYSYTMFCVRYQEWRKINGIDVAKQYKWKINEITADDLRLLRKWQRSIDRSKWEKSVAILGLYRGDKISDIAKKIDRSIRTVRKWFFKFTANGLAGVDLRRTRKVPDKVKKRTEEKSKNIMKLLHESPSLHDINRSSWSLKSIAEAYKKYYGESISMSTVSKYIRLKGYSFKRAKIVLTSPDPDYREKLNNIKRILSNLKSNEKFFSIDEYGPVAIKVRGGRGYAPKGEMKTVPQYQISKGSLICTAALELSKNQVTHFYSDKKNTEEMIKLLLVLLEEYKSEERIYFSWDAASWHASKALDKKIDEINSAEYRAAHGTPTVELAPLPSSAQFLNVIESVFSGMAKAIIHNSNYQSVDECKKAIDCYFTERNQAFLQNPKRAGNKIWGEEVVKPVFADSNACKNPAYR